MAEENERLACRQVEHLGDITPPVGDFQNLGPVARAVAFRTADHYIRQELHVDREEPVSLAGVAPAFVDIEAEPAAVVVPQLGLVGCGERLADLVERLEIGRGVRTSRTQKRRLIEEHHVGKIAVGAHSVVRKSRHRLAGELLRQRREERLLDQRALARTTRAGDDTKNAQRE